MYRQVLDLYETAVDYNPKDEKSIEFFKIVQNIYEEKPKKYAYANEADILNVALSGKTAKEWKE